MKAEVNRMSSNSEEHKSVDLYPPTWLLLDVSPLNQGGLSNMGGSCSQHLEVML